MLKTETESYTIVHNAKSKRTDVNLNTGVKSVVFDSTVRYALYNATHTRTTGSNFPDWRGRLVRGDYCTTYLSGSKRKDRVMNGYAFRVTRHISSTPPYGLLVTNERAGVLAYPSQFAQFNASLLLTADNLAKQRFVKKALKAQRQMSALVSLGELGETLRMLKNPAKSLRSGITDYVRTARRRARRVPRRHKPRVIRDTWLEYWLGWVPLISDIQDAKEALARMGEYAPFQRISATGDNASSAFSRGSDTLNASVAIEYEERRISSCSITYRGVVDIAVDPLGFRLARQNFGFDWQEFAPTIWELIPYSFLVDYFTNIGEIISALALNTSRIRWVAKTTRQTRSTSCVGLTLRKWDDPFNVLVSERILPGPPSEISETQVVRDLYTGSLVPDFQVEIPGLGNVHKWLNIAALLRLRGL